MRAGPLKRKRVRPIHRRTVSGARPPGILVGGGMLTLLFIASSALPAEYAVANEDQFSTALGLVQPGDEIVWQDGVYDGDDILYFEPATSGTAEAPITMRPQTPAGVTFRGEYKLAIGGRFLVVNGFRFDNSGYTFTTDETAYNIINFRAHSDTNRHAYDCRVTQCEIVDYDNPATPDTSKWIQMYGARNRFDHNYVSGKTTRGPLLVVELNEAPYVIEAAHRIDYNVFADRSPSEGVNEYETVRVGTSEYSEQNAHVVVSHNFFYQCSGEAEIISNKSCENIYTYNTFVECAGSLTLRHGRGCRVEGNVFLGGHVTDSGGIRITNEDHLILNNYLQDLAGTTYQSGLAIMNGTTPSGSNPDLSGSYVQVKNVVIAHNTLVNVSEPVVYGVGSGSSGRSQPPRDLTLAGNIIHGTNAPLFRVIDTPINVTYLNNLVWGTSTGIAADSDLVVADPDLNPDAMGISRPSPTSPAVDMADTQSLVSDLLDMDEAQRPTAGRDAGADEVGVGLRPEAPLTQAEVGPFWMRPFEPMKLNLNVTPSGYMLISMDAPGSAWAEELALEYASGMEGPWTNVTPIGEADDDGIFFATDDPAGAAQRFWRGWSQ